MKNAIIAISAVVCLSAFCVVDKDKKTFRKLYALEGVWAMTGKQGTICEEWNRIDENHLQGKGYMIKGKDTTINERVTLKNTDKGIFYTSTVENENDGKPISFKMTKADNNQFSFENPGHDFPKRIVYNLIDADSLNAFIDDGIDGSKKRQNFYYKKIK